MSNSYFQFKQFTVQQDKCAMKVTTDACIQGAWTPIHEGVERILDIGTGTGLLALMLAQRNAHAIIDAIEYDHNATLQAAGNVAASPWKDRINVIEADARTFPFTGKYDLIICNPPFFINSLLSNDTGKDMARHTFHLSHHDLLSLLSRHLTAEGYASILLPFNEYQQWKELARISGWLETECLLISHTTGDPVNRVVGIFCKEPHSRKTEDSLTIYGPGKTYTPEFVKLLRPFYLYL